MLVAGNREEAFKALQEYADLCPEDMEIRLLLAQGWKRAPDVAEAVGQRMDTDLTFIDLSTTKDTMRRVIRDIEEEDEDS